MFYLDQQCCQITRGLGDRGLTAPGGCGDWGPDQRRRKLQLTTSALSSTYVVATGKTEQFLANRKDATGPNEAFVNSLGVNALS